MTAAAARTERAEHAEHTEHVEHVERMERMEHMEHMEHMERAEPTERTEATEPSEHVREFALPDLGEGLTEAEIVRWLVATGDRVGVDQPVVEVETAKAVVEVPCPYAGVVTRLWAAPGELLDVGRPLLSVAPAADGTRTGADASPPEADAQAPATGQASPASENSGNVLVGYGTSAPAARRRRRRPGAPAAPAPADGASAPVASAPVASAPSPAPAPGASPGGPVPVISPLVRRLARERDVDLRGVRGSGPGGLVLRGDVERHAAEAGRPAGTPAAPRSATPEPEARGTSGAARAAGALPSAAVPRHGAPAAPEPVRIPLRGLRRTVAEKLARSRREIPDASTWVDVDATLLLDAKRQLAPRPGGSEEPVSLLALLARICVVALRRYPELNATVDTGRQEIVRLPSVHLGFAAQSERGLVVPVVRDADRMGLAELSAELRRLTAAARTGTLAPGELTGGTFTLNNYGVFGVDGSTPIINHPEAAMLGVGRILPRPWVCEGALAVRQLCQVSFTFDHRVCDGGSAGGFLRLVADLMEQPLRLLDSV